MLSKDDAFTHLCDGYYADYSSLAASLHFKATSLFVYRLHSLSSLQARSLDRREQAIRSPACQRHV